jgi:hypothetical protein
MNRLLLLLLSIPIGCLALLSFVAVLGVLALAGAIRMVGAIRSGLGLGSADGNQDPWHGMVGDAHPLDYVEGQHSAALSIWRRAPAATPRPPRGRFGIGNAMRPR